MKVFVFKDVYEIMETDTNKIQSGFVDINNNERLEFENKSCSQKTRKILIYYFPKEDIERKISFESDLLNEMFEGMNEKINRLTSEKIKNLKELVKLRSEIFDFKKHKLSYFIYKFLKKHFSKKIKKKYR